MSTLDSANIGSCGDVQKGATLRGHWMAVSHFVSSAAQSEPQAKDGVLGVSLAVITSPSLAKEGAGRWS